MKLKSIVLTGLLVGLSLASSFVEAHGWRGGGWHGGVGIYMGGPGPFFYGPPGPYGYGYGYPYPYAYSPPPVIISQPQPQVYIEQGNNGQAVTSQPQTSPSNAAGQSAGNQSYWYYCEQSDGYYPYVKECPAGWKQVTPSPPPSTSAR